MSLETSDVDDVMQRISAMLAPDPAATAQTRTWDAVESLLTEGYAGALTLESERLRIDKALSKLGSDPRLAARKLLGLSRRRAAIEHDLGRLRESLDDLGEVAARLQAARSRRNRSESPDPRSKK